MEKLVAGAEKITCECGQLMTLKEGIGKNNKPYKIWRCDDKNCKNVQWVNEKPSIKKMYEEEIKKTPPKQEIKQVAEPPIETNEIQKMWDKKERLNHKRALTMQAFGLFPPRSNEDGTTPMDRWLEIRDLRDIMLEDLYNDTRPIEKPF